MFRERAQTQWRPRDVLRADQMKRLQETLHHAELNVPYYRRRFQECGVRASDIDTLASFSERVPTLNRASLVEDISSMHAQNTVGRLIVHKTGGSSGRPLSFPRDANSIASTWADFMLTRSWWGASMGAPSAKIWGHWHQPDGRMQQALFELKEALKRHVMNIVFMSAYQMTTERMGRFVNQIRAKRPRVLYGYVSALETLGRFVVDQGLDLNLPGDACIITTSEPLFPTTRKFLRRAYQRPIAIEYGACETGLIAFECPAGSLHVMHDSLVVETVDEAGRPVPRGEPGEVTVTSLFNQAVPLIRYRLGDVAILSDRLCACGREGDIMDSIEGRRWAMITGPSGNVVYPQILTVLVMTFIPSARRFQAIQESVDHLTIRVEAASDPTSSEKIAIARELREKLGDSMQVDIERVDTIQTEKSGKYAVVKSLIHQEQPRKLDGALNS
jgi:phenylacetate-CoA ligase